MGDRPTSAPGLATARSSAAPWGRPDRTEPALGPTRISPCALCPRPRCGCDEIVAARRAERRPLAGDCVTYFKAALAALQEKAPKPPARTARALLALPPVRGRCGFGMRAACARPAAAAVAAAS